MDPLIDTRRPRSGPRAATRPWVDSVDAHTSPVRTVVGRVGTHATVRVTGEIDFASAHELDAVLTSVIDEGVDELVLEFAGVSFVDSSGLRVLVAAAHRLGVVGGPRALRIVGPTDAVHRVFDATGLTHFFRIDHRG